MWAPTFNDTVFYPSKATESDSTLMDATLVQAESTGDAVFCKRRVLRQTISPAAAIMNLLDFWPNLVEMLADAVSTETDYIRDGSSSFTTMSAGTHGMPHKSQSAELLVNGESG